MNNIFEALLYLTGFMIGVYLSFYVYDFVEDLKWKIELYLEKRREP